MTEEQCYLLVLIWHCFLSHGCKSGGSIKDTWYSLQKHILIPSQKAHCHFTSEGFSPLGLPGFPMHTTPGFAVGCSSGETRSSPWSVRCSTAVTEHGLGRKADTTQTAIAHKLKPCEP